MIYLPKIGQRTQMVLLRFDDICPTMNWRLWAGVETVLSELNIKPIVAVIPDNQDPHLRTGSPLPEFWARVRDWQSRGWTIALHGYQHVYVNGNPGRMGITPQSEFAGLAREEQEAKLHAGLRIFQENGVFTNTWVAPAHSFDSVTLEVLAAAGIKNLSDGLTCRPFADRLGLIWIPCQMWEEVKTRPYGVWTVCYHHNGWAERNVRHFRSNLAQFADRISSLQDVLAQGPWPRLSFLEGLRAWGMGMSRFSCRRWVKRGLECAGVPGWRGRISAKFSV